MPGTQQLLCILALLFAVIGAVPKPYFNYALVVAVILLSVAGLIK